MTPYISMLRGINVSGRNPVRMEKLKALYVSLGLSGVNTYIQSGNVVFRSSEKDRVELASLIQNGIRDSFGLDVPVIIRTAAEFREIIDRNPFKKADSSKLHITFLASLPGNVRRVDIVNVMDEGEDFQLSEKEIYLYCPKGYGKTRLSNQFFEKKLHVAATTRNWRTVLVLADMVGAW